MSETISEICVQLRLHLEAAVERRLGEGILLSGLDTSILAVIASRLTSPIAFTVAFEASPAPDVKYASLMAERLNLEHLIYRFDEEELYGAISAVVETMRSFDPMEIRNSAAIHIGLRITKEKGIDTIMTGDGSDELFAGYNFLQKLGKERLESRLRELWSRMSFSSIPLAERLGLEARLPYLDPEFKDFAMRLDSNYMIRREGGKVYGKWILRKAFERYLPKEIAWRSKTAIEHGSGTTILPQLFDSRICDTEFEQKRRRYLNEDKVTIRDKEQLFYYEIYRSILGVPHPIDSTGKICPQCNSNVPETATYCRTCGAYPI